MCVAHKSVSLLRCGTVVRKTSGNALQAGRLVCAHQVSFITSAASILYLSVPNDMYYNMHFTRVGNV